MARARVLCVGAAHWDLIARSPVALAVGDDVPGRVMRRPGGVALNVALGLAAKGMVARLCAVVGSDADGAALIGHATAAGVDCATIVTVEGAATNRYLAIETEDGNLFAAVADMDLLEAQPEAITDAAIRALPEAETLFLEANLPAAALEEIAREARQSGIEVVANPVSPAKAERLQTLLSHGVQPTLVLNLAEAQVLLNHPVSTAAEAAPALLGAGAGTALVTDGARQAALATPEGTAISTPPALEATASVTGAGDALLAGYLAHPARRGDARAALDAALQAAAEHMRADR